MRLRQGDEHEEARATNQPEESDSLISKEHRDPYLILDVIAACHLLVDGHGTQ